MWLCETFRLDLFAVWVHLYALSVWGGCPIFCSAARGFKTSRILYAVVMQALRYEFMKNWKLFYAGFHITGLLFCWCFHQLLFACVLITTALFKIWTKCVICSTHIYQVTCLPWKFYALLVQSEIGWLCHCVYFDSIRSMCFTHPSWYWKVQIIHL
jgi:hypothetical protein